MVPNEMPHSAEVSVTSLDNSHDETQKRGVASSVKLVLERLKKVLGIGLTPEIPPIKPRRAGDEISLK